MAVTEIVSERGVICFQCTICAEEFLSKCSIAIYGAPVCLKCFTIDIRSLFEAALQSESRYPVKWGHREIKAEWYRFLLGEDFLRLWDAKVKEYKTPPGM